jgi:hypothetical protein
MGKDIVLAARASIPVTAAASMFPGQREPGALTRFAVAHPVPSSASNATMDAATILDRQREGGGAPAERSAP